MGGHAPEGIYFDWTMNVCMSQHNYMYWLLLMNEKIIIILVDLENN